MKSWLWKLLIVLGILLSVSSARGIAADLGKVSLSRENFSGVDEASSQKALSFGEAASHVPLVQTTSGRPLSISSAFLDSANGEIVTLSPTHTLKASPSFVPSTTPQTETLFQSTGQVPTLEPARVPGDPTRIVIPAIQLDAPVVLSPIKTISVAGKEFEQWSAPEEFAAGWQEGSAQLGENGNTVLNGHHNVHGEVFRYLVDLQPGDIIQMYAGDRLYTYTITNKMILPEKYQDIDVRMDNARWIMPSSDERLTLITCWPYETNTHRLIIVALPQFSQS